MTLPAAELARATLKRLAELRLPPTPENYRQIYVELGGQADPPPRSGPPAGALEPAPAANGSDVVPKPALADLLLQLLAEWERVQAGLTQVQKRMQIEQFARMRPDEQAWGALQQMVSRWAALPNRRAEDASVEAASAATDAGAPSWRGLCLATLEQGVLPLCQQPEHNERLRGLIAQARTADSPPAALPGALRDVWIAMERQAGENAALRDALVALVRMILEHLAELMPQPWVGAQASAIGEQLQPPLDLQRVQAAQSGVRDLLLRQGVMRRSEAEAHATAKALIDLLLRKISDFSTAGDAYNIRMQDRLRQLEASREWADIHRIVSEVLEDSRAMLASSDQLSAQLRQARQQAEIAQRRIDSLEGELQQLSQQLIEDPLTGALNRRGLDAAFTREAARARRHGRPLAAALLDLDHFKRINDDYGHDAGDRVLRALVQLARRMVRPSDVIARLGGEEFMLLLPDTPGAQSGVVVQRLLDAFRGQTLLRDAQGRRVELTFSAGVGELCPKESFNQFYQRVDAALLRAKAAGRQRIEPAAPCGGAAGEPVAGGGASGDTRSLLRWRR